MCRPRALMIPWLTECVRPNGLPRARTQLPTAASSLLPSRAAGRSSRPRFSTAMSAVGVEPDLVGVDRPAVLEEDADLGRRGPLDDVVVRQDVEAAAAVAPDDHARAGLLEVADPRRLVVRPVFSATMWTTAGETTRATSSNVRLIVLELLVLPGELLVLGVLGRRASGAAAGAARVGGAAAAAWPAGPVACAERDGPPRSSRHADQDARDQRQGQDERGGGTRHGRPNSTPGPEEGAGRSTASRAGAVDRRAADGVARRVGPIAPNIPPATATSQRDPRRPDGLRSRRRRDRRRGLGGRSNDDKAAECSAVLGRAIRLPRRRPSDGSGGSANRRRPASAARLAQVHLEVAEVDVGVAVARRRAACRRSWPSAGRRRRRRNAWPVRSFSRWQSMQLLV